jgi:hypothetical protein
MMHIVASIALHYGVDYLGYAIRSIIDDVDSVIVLYSPIGSHGHSTSTPCPETRDELYAIALEAAGEKLRWFDGVWSHEGAQRDSIFSIVPDADVIVVLDSDEHYGKGIVQGAIQKGLDENVRQVLIPLVHHWRSFYKGFTHDPAAPTRIIFPKIKEGVTTFTPPTKQHVLSHFGYSIVPELMRYKWQIHGHLAELRRDVDWLNDVYLANRQYDCHPVGSDFWQVVEDIMPPESLLDHPFADMDLIG